MKARSSWLTCTFSGQLALISTRSVPLDVRSGRPCHVRPGVAVARVADERLWLTVA